MKRIIPLIIFISGMLLLAQFPQVDVEAAADLEYLGEGGSYEIGPGRHFIVKRKPFSFATVPGPKYDAVGDERVWASTKGAPPSYRHTWVDLGYVPEDCKVSYTVIDDDVDDRINTFYLNGEEIHAMPQGMVTGGQFTTSDSGNLRLHAEDSIGIWLNRCATPPTVTITSTSPPPSQTPKPTTEPSRTPGPDPTATSTHKPMASPMPSETPNFPKPLLTNTPESPTDIPVTSAPTATPEATRKTSDKERPPACLRFNFEVSGEHAREGLYEAHELGGRFLASWYAQEGWQDSGWIYGIKISYDSVYVLVHYVPPDGSPKILMRILNPAFGTTYGWAKAGVCHAIEIGWPDPNITPTPTPDINDGYNDDSDVIELDRQRFIWPDQQPTPTNTPAGSLRG